MGLRRGFGRLPGLIAAGMFLVPLLALVAALPLDRGPDGEARVTAFPLALTLLDPLVWECTRNSVLVAAAVALGAWFLGVGLSRQSRRRFRGRTLLRALVAAPLAVPPLFAALGLRGLAERFDVGNAWPGGEFGWLAWFWVELAWAVPLVAGTVSRTLERVDPSWEDAARVAGGRNGQVWRMILRPLIRPEALGAVGVVFGLVLLEPGAPLVLGLRRTLAFQAVEAALDPIARSRAAGLALIATGLAALVQVGLRRWSGPPWPEALFGPEPTPRRASWSRLLGSFLLLGGWSSVAVVPLLGLAATASLVDPIGSWRWDRFSTANFRRLLDDPRVHGFAVHSAMLGVGVASIGLALAWRIVGGRASPRFEPKTVSWMKVMPPLAVGIGLLRVPGLIEEFASGLAGISGSFEGLASAFRGLARELSPFETPGLLLGWSVLATQFPMLLRMVGSLRSRTRPLWNEAAWTLGASRWRAWRTLTLALLGPPLFAIWLRLAVLAALDTASALVLTPTSMSRTLGPGVLDLWRTPEAMPMAAALGASASALSLLALAFTSRLDRQG